MSKTSPSTTHSETQIKLAQLQVERIKDEDEQWISGEELYTEGSSDDDDAALRAKRRYDERHVRAPKKNLKSSSVKDKSDIVEQKSSIAKQYVAASPAECAVQNANETVDTIGIKNENKTLNSIVVINETGTVRTVVGVDETGTMNTVGLAVESQDCYDVQHPIHNDNDGCDLYVETDDSEISWRPKRGSIKLPNVAVEGRIVELLTNSQM